MTDDWHGDLSLALRMADAADDITMRHFNQGPVAFTSKSDGSPVSDADLEVERRLCEIVADERPGDAVLGEEVGAVGNAPRRWIIDGIDGTILFVQGLVGWSTQIALEVDGRVTVGVTTSPSREARWWAARGQGAWRQSTHEGVHASPTPLSVSDGSAAARTRYTAIPPLDALPPDALAEIAGLAAAFDYVAPVGHGALMVAEGAIEVCVQPFGGPWDFAALAVLVEEAGGRFSDLAGEANISQGGPVVYSNARVHDTVLAHLRRSGPEAAR